MAFTLGLLAAFGFAADYQAVDDQGDKALGYLEPSGNKALGYLEPSGDKALGYLEPSGVNASGG